MIAPVRLVTGSYDTSPSDIESALRVDPSLIKPGAGNLRDGSGSLEPHTGQVFGDIIGIVRVRTFSKLTDLKISVGTCS